MTVKTGYPYDLLSDELKKNHYKNANGCLVTEYSKIDGLEMLATDTNGTSGVCKWRGEKMYFWYSYPQDRFVVEVY